MRSYLQVDQTLRPLVLSKTILLFSLFMCILLSTDPHVLDIDLIGYLNSSSGSSSSFDSAVANIDFKTLKTLLSRFHLGLSSHFYYPLQMNFY